MGLLGLAAGCARQPLQVEFTGCEAVQRGSICMLGDGKTTKRNLKIFVKTTNTGPIAFDTDAGTPGSSRTAEAIYSVSVSPTAAWLQLRPANSSSGAPVRITLRPLVKPSFIRASNELRNQDRVEEAEKIVREHLQSDLSPMERAWAYGELGRSLRELRRPPLAIDAMKEAIRLDREANLLLNEGSDTFLLAEIYLEERRSTDVDRLLSEHAELIGQLPETRPWFYHYQARALELRGDLQGALKALEHGESLARDLQDRRSEQMLAATRGSIDVELGRPDQADKLVSRAIGKMGDEPCKQGLLLELQARMRLDVLESILGEGEIKDDTALTELWHKWEEAVSGGASAPTVALWHDGRLQSILHKALAVLEDGTCAQPQYVAKTQLGQARLALLMSRNDDADIALAAAERILSPSGGPQKDPTLNLQWATLKARLALKRGRLSEAAQLFDNLNQLAQQGDDPYAARWRAALGRAQTLLREKKDVEAHAALLTAQRLLVERARQTSVLLGRSSFLGRHAWSTSLLVEQQYRMGLLAEAWKTMRESRVHALAELRVFSKVATLTPEQRQKWVATLDRYYALRRAPELVTGPNGEGAHAPLLYPQRREAELLQEAMQLLSEPLGEPQYREPLPNELMLTCRPLNSGWLCLTARQDKGKLVVQPTKLPKLDPAAASSELAAALLTPIAPLLRTKTTLTVLGYGAFRRIAIHMLPWNGRRLDEWIDVRYALDVPGLPDASPPQCGPALVVIPEEIEVQTKLVLANPIVNLLTGAGMLPQLETQDRRHIRLNTGKPSRSLDLIVREQLQRVPFAHFTSHGEYSHAEHWLSQLRLSSFTTLTAGDILALEHVPAQVSLISCQSGASQDPLGGQEALGLAYAFLLRGSREVLATTRVVSALAGSLVAQAVYERWQCGQSLTPAWRGAVSALAQDSRIAAELDAFRVFSR